MTIAELLEKVGQQGIELWLEGDELRFRAPKGALTPELRDLIVGRKPEIIAHLKEQSQAAVTYAPLSFGQQSMWFIRQMAPESVAYNVVFVARICSAVDMPVMKRTWQTIVDRHPMLRTTYILKDGVPAQAIHSRSEIVMDTVDVSAMSPEATQQLVKDTAEQPVDLANGPILHLYLFSRTNDDHILLMVTHHIAIDGWSLWLMLDDFHALYPAYLKGESVSLPRPEAAYGDYVDWLNNLVNGPNGEKLRTYWHNNLADNQTPLSLPTDHPRPPVFTYNGASHMFVLDEVLTRRLRELAKAEGATLYMLLLTAFEVLLYRYSGQQEIAVGSPTFGRSRPEFASIVGHFVNMVTLHGDFNGNPSFRQALAAMRRTVLEALDHQDYPFMLLAQQLDHSRDASRSAVFQASFDLQRLQQNRTFSNLFLPHKDNVRVELGGLAVEPYVLSQQEGQFDISLQIVEVQDLLPGALKYNADLFDAATIERMGKHFVTLLQSIVDNVETPVDQIGLLTDDERQFILVDWNNTQADFPQNVGLHQLFEAQAARTPDATALIFEDATITYQQLNQRANQLAHHLRGLGVGPDTVVGMGTERSILMVVGLLGILKAGGAYISLDPNYPPERLAFMLEDTGLKLMLTQDHLKDKFPAHNAQVICLDTDWATINTQPDSNPASVTTPENMAYVIYTSGSTGRPKGVMAPHRSAVNRFNWMWRTYPFAAGEVNSQKTTLNFVDAVWEIFGALLQGVPTVIIPDQTVQDPMLMVETLSKQRVSRLVLVPSLLRAILESGRTAQLEHLKYCVTSGEALPLDLAKRFRSLLPGCTLINLYGSSEVAGDVTYYEVTEATEFASIPIGRPIDNSSIYILDRQRRVVPVGVPGEIFAGGAGLAHGYFNRPDLTADRFIENPLKAEAAPRLYRTGDLGRYLPDGNIEYLGRVDNQIKLRGFRIELGEVEAALADYPGVTQSLVMLREDRPGDQQLVGYVVANPAPDSADLWAALKRRLPAYMIPSAFVMLSEMPLTPNGKVNRLALPVPDEAGREDIPFIAPRTPIEEGIAGVWAEVLGIERMGVYDNFFDLGGHSLKATQVTARLRDVFSVDVPVRALLDQPTLAEFAKTVEALLHGADDQKAESPITVVSRTGKVALSFAQERMWIIDQMMHTGAAYNIPGAIRLKGHLNFGALERSLTEIVRRHEVLRTAYLPAEGGVQQTIAAPASITLTVETTVNDNDHIQTWLRQQAADIFDLAQGPLLRVRLLRLSDDEHILMLIMHHIVSDGWSMGVLVREFTTLYAAYASGAELPLPELPIQYADFAAWQRQALSDNGLTADIAYWKERLGGSLPVLTLPTNRPRPAIQTFPGATYNFALSPQMTDDLKRLSRREKVTLFMTLLAAFKVLMWRYTGQEDVIVGTPIANRQRAEIEGLIGFFVNTLALRTDLSGDPTFADLLKRVREVALGAYAHQNMPFEKLVEVLRPERSVSFSPIFQVMFVLQNAPLGTVELPDLTVESENVDVGASKFDLTLTLREADNSLLGNIEYNTDLFDPSTIEQLEQHFAILLESIIARSTAPISALPLLKAEERQHILLDWNQTAVAYPQDVCLHQLFEAQVERTPDAVAVIFEGQSLTYRDLNARANQLAHYLLGLNVGADMLVGVCMERSLEMVVSLYAILKAGGAYVPMDPEYPAARLAYMLQDSNVAVLLTQERLIAQLPEHRARVISVDSQWETIANESRDNLPLTITPDNLAYMIYTSGSTGNPKGAMNAHRGIVNRLLWMQDAFKLDASDHILQKTPFSFDVSVWEFFWPLITGAQLVVARPGGHRDPAYMVNIIVEQGITTLHFVPSMLELFVKEANVEACISLKRVMCSGEALPLELQNRFFERLPAELHNLYGPTEAAVDVTWWACQRNSPLRTVPIGKPIANTQIYILDKHMEPVPVGVGGELFIGGVQVGKGYLSRPELTAEKFIADPFSSRPDAKLYRSGDLARYLPDGNVDYLGRIDNQIKLRGFRIELGEIETVLTQVAGVRESLVMLREDTPGDKRLVAYLVANPAPTPNDLRAYLKDKLPDYMVPSNFVMLESMPLSPNGKADRKALPTPEYGQVTRERTVAAPQTAMEQVVLEVWQSILGIERVDIYDNFFDLGGHSLQTIEMINKLAERTGVRIDPTAVRFQTLGQIAASYDELVAQGAPSAAKAEPAEQSGLGQRLLKGLFQRGE